MNYEITWVERVVHRTNKSFEDWNEAYDWAKNYEYYDTFNTESVIVDSNTLDIEIRENSK